MARLSESVHVPAPPETAWRTAADLSRLGEWMTMHEAWRGEVPSELATGTELTSVVSVKGMRNRITWHITSYDPPHALTLEGDGVGGTTVSLALSITEDGGSGGSRVGFDVEFGGKLVFGPVGMTVKRALKSDVHTSVENLAALLR
ncbi:SRPBCC family protein [Haloechinothrix salitolerans]|uniref:SRPBCC family protein n=1 Tax=Haloechinothrix salitolerans TaxID=926830 RepID=A0ABW2BXG5_9PSEU